MATKSIQALREIVVGLFVLIIFAGLFLFTVILSGGDILHHTEKTQIDVNFERVGGLRRHDSILVRGMPVGEVDHLELTDDGVLVHLKLDRAITIRQGYRFRPESSSLLGGMQLILETGSGAPVDTSKPLLGESPENVMENINDAVTEIRTALNEGGIITNFEAIVADIADVTHRLRAGEGTIGRLLSTNDTIYVDLEKSIANIRKISDRLEEGDGTLGKLLSSDSKIYDDIASAVTDIKEITARLNGGEGSLGKLLSADDSLYADLSEAISSLKTIASRLEKGEGALGELMKEDGELSVELKSIIKDGHDLLDDYRETSPVSTFSSIFFGAL